MKIPQEKSFLTLPVPSVLKIIEMKNDINFYYHASFVVFPVIRDWSDSRDIWIRLGRFGSKFPNF